MIDMDSELDDYSLVVAPINYMYRGNYIEKVRDFVKNGGNYVTTFWSGEVDDSDLCFLDQHPLRDVLGIRTEEIDVRPEYTRNQILWEGRSYEIRDLCALVHKESADVLASYAADFYVGRPALTKNKYGNGTAYFIAAEGKIDFLKDFFQKVTGELHLGCTLQAQLPDGVHVSERSCEDYILYFVQNYNNQETSVVFCEDCTDIESSAGVNDTYIMKPYQMLILKKNIKDS